LPYSAKAIGFGLSLRFAARPFKIGQAPCERVSLEFGCADLPLKLCEPGIVGERVLDAATAAPALIPEPGIVTVAVAIPSMGARITARRALMTASRLTLTTSC